MKEKIKELLGMMRTKINNADSHAKHKLGYAMIREELQAAMIDFDKALALLAEEEKTFSSARKVFQKYLPKHMAEEDKEKLDEQIIQLMQEVERYKSMHQEISELNTEIKQRLKQALKG